MIWKGHISVGLVNIPVAFHPAEVREELDFTLLDPDEAVPRHADRVRAGPRILILLRFASELRDPRALRAPGKGPKALGITDKEVRMAETTTKEAPARLKRAEVIDLMEPIGTADAAEGDPR